MTTVVTRGAASAQALGYAARATAANYIEDVFSTYLYTGTGAGQTITNGIDLSGKGGMVWAKNRSSSDNHYIVDTARGATKYICSDLSQAEITSSSYFSSLNSNGFTVGTNLSALSTWNYASWTFRKQAKFFDVVTYTGTGSTQNISHSLGSAPGCMIIKRTSGAANWAVYHRSLASKTLQLNNTNAEQPDFNAYFANTAPTSTVFTVGTDADTNASGSTYVAYLFAHNAGGFGASGTDNVISCGSFTTDGSGNATVTLGYEPQMCIIKPSSTTGNWDMFDIMRGYVANTSGTNQKLSANLSNGEIGSNYTFINSTGFSTLGAAASTTYIYIAVRRGPMRTPTSGTSVFSPIASTSATGTVKTTNFPVDLQIQGYRPGSVSTSPRFVDRLRGVSTNTTETGPFLLSSATNAEAASTNDTRFWDNTGFQQPSAWDGSDVIFWNFRRAPGFFDEVCYTGTGSSGLSVSHNLGVTPEMIIIKRRDGSGTNSWRVFTSLGASDFYRNILEQTTAGTLTSYSTSLLSQQPTSTNIYVGTDTDVNASGGTYVSYLFASVAGVSKVGTYTGTGTTNQIDCGFTGGARFVLIKRRNSTGDWYVWDSARGIVAGNDPYLLLNSTATEVTNTDYVDTYSAGFEISSTAPAAINANGGTFIFLAIA
jgi:hypothetical protein